MLCASDIYTLITYVGFVNYLFYGVTVAGLIVLRVQQPSMQRPIKVTADESSLLSHPRHLRAQHYTAELFPAVLW